MQNRVELKELIELFTLFTANELDSGKEMPRIKFVFGKEAEDLFTTVMNYPFKRDGCYSPNIEEKDIKRVMSLPGDSCYNIKVNNELIFFDYLTKITNYQLRLYEIFGEKRIPREHCRYIMRRLWLRMGPNDFNNLEQFLRNQLSFLKDATLDEYRFKKTITNYYDYDVEAELKVNRSWDESSRRMTFKIYNEDKENYHSLPSILYDIDGDTCYIYATQNERFLTRNKVSKIERLLYKLNKGIDNPTVHPSKILSMMLFIDILKNTNIKTIKVPTLQVLSYDYHEILSKKENAKFKDKWTKERLDRLKNSNLLQEEYEHDINWYHNVVNKQDLISKSKTESLIDTVYRVVSSDRDLTLTSDIDISDELIIKINNKQKTLGGRKC